MDSSGATVCLIPRTSKPIPDNTATEASSRRSLERIRHAGLELQAVSLVVRRAHQRLTTTGPKQKPPRLWSPRNHDVVSRRPLNAKTQCRKVAKSSKI